MADAKRVRDVVTFGSPESINANLTRMCVRFEDLANHIWEQASLQEAARVFPYMLRCIARQLRILKASAELPIEVAAGACRTVFELNVRTRLMTASPDRIKEFWVERVFQEISLLKAFLSLSPDAPETRRKPLNDRIEELRRYASKWNLAKPSGDPSVRQMAKLAGVAEEYDALYGFYSKYTHGTAWLVNTRDEERDGEGYRNILIVATQLYAADAYRRIDEFAREHK